MLNNIDQNLKYHKCSFIGLSVMRCCNLVGKELSGRSQDVLIGRWCDEGRALSVWSRKFDVNGTGLGRKGHNISETERGVCIREGIGRDIMFKKLRKVCSLARGMMYRFWWKRLVLGERRERGGDGVQQRPTAYVHHYQYSAAYSTCSSGSILSLPVATRWAFSNTSVVLMG